MCGIAGKASSKDRVDRHLVERMCSAMVHRGPDAQGIHGGDGIALGIRRLRVIDLETGDQPVYNEDGTVAVVLNGEIYNYRELRERLRRSGHTLTTQGDTEVIAHLYEEHGPDCVRELHGMFAFAIWDSRRKRLLLARDRVGKKPLFYWQRDGSIAFASELAALAQDPATPREVDPVALDAYLAYGYIPHPLSIWQGVRKLPPAHTLLFEGGGATTERYWRLDYSQKLDGSPAELAEELRGAIERAVRRRMIADVPLGAFLSGGVDSSIVVSEMAAASPAPVRTFSIGFEEERFSELGRARLVAQRFETEHEELVVRPDAVELLPRLVRHYGEPFADSSAIPSFSLAEMTSRHVTVALNGDGGDESFAGYRRHLANALTRGADRLPRLLARSAAKLGEHIPGAGNASTNAEYASRLLRSLADGPLERYRSHVGLFSSAQRDSLLTPELRVDLDESTQPPDPFARAWQESTAGNRLDVLLDVDASTYLPGDLLAKMDIASMAHSLEARSPLLDHEVMELAAALPAHLKARGLRKKVLLRDAYRDRVPDEVLDGPKQGFGVPVGKWFRGELRNHLDEVLLDPAVPIGGWLDRDAVEALVSEHARGRVDHGQRLWALLFLAQWQHEFAAAPTTP